MTPKTFIFIGRSGCGKGTQADLLMKYIKEKDPKGEVYYMETGARFRDFLKGNTLSSKLSKKISEAGNLQPEFLSIYMWSNHLIDDLKGGEHLFIDGSPRKLHEAEVLDSAMKFYGREKPIVIFMNVSRKWSEERLFSRHRQDDAKDNVKKRLDWYDAEVAPTVEYYRKNPEYIFLDINGERSIEEIHEDIKRRLEL